MISENLVHRGSLEPPQIIPQDFLSNSSTFSKKRQFDSALNCDNPPAKKPRSCHCPEQSISNVIFHKSDNCHGSSVLTWLESMIEPSDSLQERNVPSDSFQDPDLQSIPDSTKEFLAMLSNPSRKGGSIITAQTSKTSNENATSSPIYRKLNLATNGINVLSEVECDLRNSKEDSRFPAWVQHVVTCVESDPSTPIMKMHDDVLEHNYKKLHHLLHDPQILFIEETVKKSLSSCIDPLALNRLGNYVQTLSEASCEHFTALAMANSPFLRKHALIKPIPDQAFGYQASSFPKFELDLWERSNVLQSNASGLLFPYLIVEYKPMGGNLWHAANQCIGGLAVSLNQTERVVGDEQAVFGLCMNDQVADIYIMWSIPHTDENFKRNYLVYKLDSIVLSKKDQFKRLWKILINIHEWAATTRLKDIDHKLGHYLAKSDVLIPLITFSTFNTIIY
ncbi:uncharacterized protein F4807DRAFT_449084 [Annulohypoxylon truncatum]|uniref:uncharacterized protein n=1 Tax=Annulohypoxylon truncatum TaxID=327061 RepID=UPI0020074913|nr:uncharacterized protein F4807DRAFT_449084 [Annulohypoxylon truncatum]KAI1204055.1 hypothetical protein F4807DRAFT_449084 [Annulohypoxylon truncatum]